MGCSGEDRRRAARVKLFQPAEMRGPSGEAARVHLLNVSVSGALVYSAAVPEVGDEVRLACGMTLGDARVAWREGRRFGVTFAEPIGAAEIEAIVRSQNALIESATERLGLPPVKLASRT